MVVTLCLGGLILCSPGIVGEYLGRVFQEVKGQPQYVVRRRTGLEDREKRLQEKIFEIFSGNFSRDSREM